MVLVGVVLGIMVLMGKRLAEFIFIWWVIVPSGGSCPRTEYVV